RAARRHQRHHAAVVGVGRDLRRLVDGADGDDPVEPGGRVALGVDAEVAGGGDDDGAGGDGVVHRVLHGLRHAGAAKAHVDDVGGVGIVGHAVDVDAGRPADGVGDVAVDAGAVVDAERARDDQAAVPIDPGDADAVVALGGEDAGDVRAVQRRAG